MTAEHALTLVAGVFGRSNGSSVPWLDIQLHPVQGRIPVLGSSGTVVCAKAVVVMAELGPPSSVGLDIERGGQSFLAVGVLTGAVVMQRCGCFRWDIVKNLLC